MNLLEEIHASFPVKEVDLRQYAPLKLAYLGDAVFEILMRTLVIERVGGPVKNLHKETSRFVNAGAQSMLVQAMLEDLTEDEMRHTVTDAMPRHLLWQNMQIYMTIAMLPDWRRYLGTYI